LRGHRRIFWHRSRHHSTGMGPILFGWRRRGPLLHHSLDRCAACPRLCGCPIGASRRVATTHICNICFIIRLPRSPYHRLGCPRRGTGHVRHFRALLIILQIPFRVHVPGFPDPAGMHHRWRGIDLHSPIGSRIF